MWRRDGPQPIKWCICHLICFSYVSWYLSSSGQALDFAGEIDSFVGQNRNLQALELDQNDWVAISQVARWLKAFRSATTEMSKTKEPMLSTFTLSSEVFKTMCLLRCRNSQTRLHLNWGLGLLRPTPSLATTIFTQTNHLTIHGQHVSTSFQYTMDAYHFFYY